MFKINPLKKLATGVFVAVIAATGVAQAKFFTELTEQGYKLSKLTTGKSGMPGWIASNGTKQYFCRMRLGLVYAASVIAAKHCIVERSGAIPIESAPGHFQLLRDMYQRDRGG